MFRVRTVYNKNATWVKSKDNLLVYYIRSPFLMIYKITDLWPIWSVIHLLKNDNTYAFLHEKNIFDVSFNSFNLSLAFDPFYSLSIH